MYAIKYININKKLEVCAGCAAVLMLGWVGSGFDDKREVKQTRAQYTFKRHLRYATCQFSAFLFVCLQQYRANVISEVMVLIGGTRRGFLRAWQVLQDIVIFVSIKVIIRDEV